MKKLMKNKNDLKNVFEEAKNNGLDVILELTVPNSDSSEIIVVRYSNLEFKQKYYEENYDEHLKLKRCNDIEILTASAQHFEY